MEWGMRVKGDEKRANSKRLYGANPQAYKWGIGCACTEKEHMVVTRLKVLWN